MKEEIDKIRQNNNNKERIIENYISLIKLISNEFDKILLYNNNFWKEKYLNKNIYIDNKDINNKNLEINFNKVKHNLMDLCILSSSYLKGSNKDFLLEGINLIRNLENLYKEKKMKTQNNKCNNYHYNIYYNNLINIIIIIRHICQSRNISNIIIIIIRIT